MRGINVIIIIIIIITAVTAVGVFSLVPVRAVQRIRYTIGSAIRRTWRRYVNSSGM